VVYEVVSTRCSDAPERLRWGLPYPSMAAGGLAAEGTLVVQELSDQELLTFYLRD
jgi:hypothetical protein